MTGQGLYAHWMAANGEANTHVDGWELLEEADHQIWEAFARRMNRHTARIDLQLTASLTESIVNNLLEARPRFHGTMVISIGQYDAAMTNVRALRSLLLLKETQQENAVYRGANDD